MVLSDRIEAHQWRMRRRREAGVPYPSRELLGRDVVVDYDVVHSRSAHRLREVRAANVERGERRARARARLELLLSAPVGPATAVGLAELTAEGLDDATLVLRLKVADAVAAWAQAQAAAALADLVRDERPGPSGEEHERQLRLEVRVARSCSDDAAGRDIATARALAGPCGPVRELWASGAITGRHVWAVLDRTAGHHDDVVTAAVGLVVPRLPRMTSSRVRKAMSTAIARVDPEAQAQRARARRRHDVGVRLRDTGDSLADVILTLRAEDARACVERIDSDADVFLRHVGQGCEPCRESTPAEIGPARAAVARALLLADGGGAADAIPGPGRRARRGELQVVLSLSTLLGLDENPGLLNGSPVPAQIARELATECGSMRRIVTDPVTGHALDYGTRVYLPDRLREFLVARDRTCRGPGCGQPAHRSQLDHVIPFPTGPSSAGNGHMLCKRDHDLKTSGYLRVREEPDGTRSWLTGLGQTVPAGPEPYVDEPIPF